MIGQIFSQYRILEKLGSGGMGEVYLAEDVRLERQVALKILPATVGSDQQLVRRFLQEAKTASALNHPNVCVIHEVGELDDGRPFFAMEYIQGQGLDAKIQSGPLDAGNVVDLGIQIADALDEAHSKGITHRDIKPANLMITPQGRVKVLDFGIAKVVEQRARILSSGAITQARTDPGRVMGTVQYMSPEQALGEEVDHRTDIFSLGAVLYEMATRTPPFAGSTPAAIFDAILHQAPISPIRLNPQLPPELEPIITRALEKDRNLRYQTASDLRADLMRLKRDTPSGPMARGGGISWPRIKPRRVAVASLALGLLALLGVTFRLLNSHGGSIDSVAVLPLVNAGSDPDVEYLSDGITESVINGLSQLSQLKVMAYSTVSRYKGRNVDPRDVGSGLGVGAVLTGRLHQRGDILIIQTELVDVASGSQLWGEQYHRKLANILGLQEEISQEIAEKLRLRLSREQKQRLAKHFTEDAEAYQLYLKGRYFWNKRTSEGLHKGIDYFHQAIRRDQNYALAYAGLADSYALLGTSGYAVLPPQEATREVKNAALKALALDDGLAEAHASLGLAKMVYEWDWPGAEKELQEAIRQNPNYSTGHHWYSIYLSVKEQLSEAIAEARRAQEIDPLSLIINSALARTLYYARQYDQSMEQCRKLVEIDPDSYRGHYYLGAAYGQKGMFQEAISALQKSVELSNGAPSVLGMLGYTYAVSGREREALTVLEQLKALSKQGSLVSYSVATIYTGLGDNEKAFEWLDMAYSVERSDSLIFITVEPTMDRLRSDPRFQQLIKRMGL